MCVCVCVCVVEWKGSREERGGGGGYVAEGRVGERQRVCVEEWGTVCVCEWQGEREVIIEGSRVTE